MEHTLETPSGSVVLGSTEEVTAAMESIAGVTGGSSGAGRWSHVFGVGYESGRFADGDVVEAIAREAADLRAALGDLADESAKLFLDRLAALER